MRAIFASVLASALGWAVGIVARVWLMTLRVRVVLHPALERALDRPWVFAFFHGTQWPLLAWPHRRRTVVLVSLSRDGAIQARALRVQGFRVVRGSSSRGGARGLAALVRVMKSERCDAAFAVDGPRGPYGRAKPGAILAARATRGLLVPMGSAISRGTVLARAWDKFAIAWPFTRVTVVLGEPIDPASPDGAEDDMTEGMARLERAIEAANARAAGGGAESREHEEGVTCAAS